MADNLAPSPICSILLERLEGVSSGELDAKTLAMSILEQLTLIERTRREIISRLENYSGMGFVLAADKLEDIKASLNDYEAALKDAASYLESGDAEKGNSAVDNLIKVGSGGRLVFEGYTPEDAEMGPTAMPIVNILVHLCGAHAAGEVSKEAVVRTMTSIVANCCLLTYDLEDNKEADPYSRDILVGAYNNFSDAVLELEPLLDLGAESVNAQIDIIIETGNALKEAITKFSVAMATRGPSKMELANVILNTASGWRKGSIATENFSESLAQFKTSLDDLWREIESIVAIPNSCPDIAEEAVNCRKAFEKHFEAIAMFEAVLNGEENKFDEAFNLLVEAANDLDASKEKFNKIGEQVDKVPCVHCGSLNVPGSNVCSNCGAKILNPNMGSSSSIDFQEGGSMNADGNAANNLVMTENLLILFDAVNKVAEGKIDANEYNEVLNWFANLVDEHLINMAPEPEVDTSGFNEEEVEQMRAFQERIAGYRASIDEGAHAMLAAIEHMRQYIVDNNSLNLVEGVRELRDASIIVQTAAKEVGELIEACKEQGGMPAAESEE
ncbi:zinc ribbon domain-containing protein [bacterium]|nr:zinc ribbon domain-containing protein [bacterium]